MQLLPVVHGKVTLAITMINSYVLGMRMVHWQRTLQGQTCCCCCCQVLGGKQNRTVASSAIAAAKSTAASHSSNSHYHFHSPDICKVVEMLMPYTTAHFTSNGSKASVEDKSCTERAHV